MVCAWCTTQVAVPGSVCLQMAVCICGRQRHQRPCRIAMQAQVHAAENRSQGLACAARLQCLVEDGGRLALAHALARALAHALALALVLAQNLAQDLVGAGRGHCRAKCPGQQPTSQLKCV